MIILLILLGLNSTLYAADNCRDLMRSFFNHQEGNVISNKTAKMDVEKFGLAENVVNRQKFERLYTQCLSPDKNKLKDLAEKRFSKINTGMGMATSIIGYTQRNWEQEKDFEWFARLGYGLALGTVASQLAQKIISNHGNRFAEVVKNYIFGRSLTLVYFAGASLLFESNKAQQEKLEELKSDPHFKEDIKKLKAYAEDESRLDRIKNEIISYLSQLEVINIGIGVHEGIDFDNLKPSDLEDKDIQEVIIAAILAQEYEQQKGALAITGSKQNDFLLFDSLYSIAKIPKDIIVDKIINQTMCLNSNNLTRAYTQAIGITAINQILFADYYGITYHVLQKELIDQ